jgi:hypothetical protein
MTSHWQYLWVIGLVQDHNIHIPAFKHVPVTNKLLASHWQYIYESSSGWFKTKISIYQHPYMYCPSKLVNLLHHIGSIYGSSDWFKTKISVYQHIFNVLFVLTSICFVGVSCFIYVICMYLLYWCSTRFSHQMMFVSFNSNTTVVTCGTGTGNPYEAPEFTPSFNLIGLLGF